MQKVKEKCSFCGITVELDSYLIEGDLIFCDFCYEAYEEEK